MLYWHDGKKDFPHGAGPSEEGWYYYPEKNMKVEPNGPYATEEEALMSYHYQFVGMVERFHREVPFPSVQAFRDMLYYAVTHDEAGCRRILDENILED